MRLFQAACPELYVQNLDCRTYSVRYIYDVDSLNMQTINKRPFIKGPKCVFHQKFIYLVHDLYEVAFFEQTTKKNTQNI